MINKTFSILLLLLCTLTINAQFSRELCDYYDESGVLYENIKTENTISAAGNILRSLITTKNVTGDIIATQKIENIFNATDQIARQIITDYNGAINLGIILYSSKEENIYSAEGYLQRSILTRNDESGIAVSAIKVENINNAAGQITRQIVTNYSGDIFTGTVIGTRKEENIYGAEGYLQRSILTRNDLDGNALSALKIENINNVAGQITRQIITNYSGDIFTGNITDSTKEENIYSAEGNLQRSILTRNDLDGNALSALKIENINNVAGQITRQIITNYSGDIFTGNITGSTKEENIYSAEGYLQRSILSRRDPESVVFYTRKTELINNALGSVQRNITTEYDGPLPDANIIGGIKIENLYDTSDRVVRIRISRLIDEVYVLESQCSYIYPNLTIDADGDGFSDEEDCDDTDPDINPDALEICDGLDNNCDGQIDEDLPLATYYADTDGDGYGDINNPLELCEITDGYVSNSTDCNDLESNVYPDAPEVCDGIDNNCNGDIDEDLLISFYEDADMDGFGNIDVSILSCTQPAGYVSDNSDCDDSNAQINPEADEILNNGIDENCDGMDGISAINQTELTKVNIFPNPASSNLNVVLDDKIDFILRLYDLNGKKIIQQVNPQKINVANIAAGIYWIELMTDSKAIAREKIVITH